RARVARARVAATVAGRRGSVALPSRRAVDDVRSPRAARARGFICRSASVCYFSRRMDTYQILSDVPRYTEFMSVAELSASSRELARRFPKLVTLQAIGTSLEGRPLELLTIGNGPRKALLFGTPHPNEPIGTLTLEFLSRRL